MSSQPTILVVATPAEGAELCRCLAEAGLRSVLSGGGDDTIELYAQKPADVIVLRTTLAEGDALAFTSAVRSTAEIPPLFVVVGDPEGPVRTALDALEFQADRFLTWPPHSKALGFAVRSCLEVNRDFERAPQTLGGVARMAQDVTSLGVAASVPPPALFDAVKPAAQVERTEVSVAGVALFAQRSPMEGLVSSVLSDAVSDLIRSQVDSLLGAAEPVDPWDRSQRDELPTEPSVRGGGAWEPTQVLAGPRTAAVSANGATSSGASQITGPASIKGGLGSASATERMAASSSPSTPAAPVPPESPSPASGIALGQQRARAEDDEDFGEDPTRIRGSADTQAGTFVRELRQKMSDMERRLFGDDDARPASSARADSEPDFDLDALAVGRDLGGPQHDPESFSDVAETVVSSQRVSDVAPSGRAPSPEILRGDLRDQDVPELVARMHKEAFTGWLQVRHADSQKVIFFEQGRPVFATSNLTHDRMGDLLYREGKITREQYAQSRTVVAETGRRMGEILVEKGFLKRRELLPAVRRHVEDIFYSVFSWDVGEFSLHPDKEAHKEKIRLAASPVSLLLEGIRRKVSRERLERKMGPPSVVVVPATEEELGGRTIGKALEDVDLSEDERIVLSRFDGRLSLAEVADCSPLTLSEIYPLAFGILVLGLARLFEDGRDATDSGRQEQSAPLAGVADVRIDRERVLAKHAHVVRADYFTVLGVRRDATGFEIRRAYEGARRDYSVDSFPQEVQRELVQEISAISQVLDEAYQVLRYDQMRRSYLDHLVD